VAPCVVGGVERGTKRPAVAGVGEANAPGGRREVRAGPERTAGRGPALTAVKDSGTNPGAAVVPEGVVDSGASGAVMAERDAEAVIADGAATGWAASPQPARNPVASAIAAPMASTVTGLLLSLRPAPSCAPPATARWPRPAAASWPMSSAGSRIPFRMTS
jgi:hypothetical protein